MARHHRDHRPLVYVVALVPAAAYLLCIWHYAVNAPFADDWSTPPLVSDAIHGRLTLATLWSQYSEARLVTSHLVFAAFGFTDRLNLRGVVLFGALVFVTTYILLLVLFRRYLQRPLGFAPVLALGIVWFSLADITNALWAFQLAWYLALFFLFAMLFFLFERPRNPRLALTLAIVAAVGGSLSMLQGFLLWPIGLVCLIWMRTDARKRTAEIVVWLLAALVTTIAYLPGYKFGKGCYPLDNDCSLGATARRPGLVARFFLTLVGNVVPHWRSSTLVYAQLLGAALVVVAVAVIVRSIRERDRVTPRLPLPLLLVTYALLFDAAIALGRANEGTSAGLQDRFAMPNILLLVGLLVFAWRHPPRRPAGRGHRELRNTVAIAGCLALGILLLAQTVVSARYGIRTARDLRAAQVLDARTVVNLDQVPLVQRGCYVNTYVWNGVYRPIVALGFLRPRLKAARADHLMVFAPGPFRRYRAQGPPPHPSGCTTATHLAPLK